MKFISEAETKKNIPNLLKDILILGNKHSQSSLVIGLVGNLGSGKTFFVKNLLATLGVKEKVSSPTFVLMREYALKKNKFNKIYNRAYHIDTYRLSNVKDLQAIKLDEVLKNKNAIVLIEWADKIKKYLPKKTIWIKFRHGAKENERHINT